MIRDLLQVWHVDVPWMDPHAAAATFADMPVLALLDSTGPVAEDSRFAYLCVDPFQVISWKGDGASAGLDALGQLLSRFDLVPDSEGMPFRAGLAGFIGYEVGASLEGIATTPAGSDDPPDLFVGVFDIVIGFDRARRTCRIHATGLPEQGSSARQARAEARLAFAAERLRRPAPPTTQLPAANWQPDWSREDYDARIHRILDYIAAGDIFQTNLTMRHQSARPNGLDPWAAYAALRKANPAPFGAWLCCSDYTLCCSSPERFISLEPAGRMQTRPIKGTARRVSDPMLDKESLNRLLQSAKDRAENVMIVDVLRNDLGRVAQIGSINVQALCTPVSYASLHHLVSTVTGRLRYGLKPVDLLRASLPGGSITGAPKIRAMQIIAEVEARRRGPYCGNVIAIGFDGFMDSNVVIRSLELTPTRMIAQSGGGIVSDSDAALEYDEMLSKFDPVRRLFGAAA